MQILKAKSAMSFQLATLKKFFVAALLQLNSVRLTMAMMILKKQRMNY